MNIAKKVLLGSLLYSYASYSQSDNTNCFIYRDDIGAFWGIKGYEEQVTEVGSHHGILEWPQFRFFGTFDSGSVRRGNFKIYSLAKKGLILFYE
jgi:hypothetical protein